MPYDDDEKLMADFANANIPLSEWNQRNHVAIAYLYLQAHGFDRGLELLREGIKGFNAKQGIEEGPTVGYNETTTVALLTIIDTVMRAYQEVFPVTTASEFCDAHPELMNKHVLRFFYSPERRMHPEAKARFVEPDLAPLPKL